MTSAPFLRSVGWWQVATGEAAPLTAPHQALLRPHAAEAAFHAEALMKFTSEAAVVEAVAGTVGAASVASASASAASAASTGPGKASSPWALGLPMAGCRFLRKAIFLAAVRSGFRAAVTGARAGCEAGHISEGGPG